MFERKRPEITEFIGMGNSSLFHVYDLAAYVTVLVGYLLGIGLASHLTLLAFILFTGANLLWIALFLYMERCYSSPREFFWLSAGMILLALLADATVSLGTNFDWLLASVTVGVLATQLPWRMSVAITILMYVGSVGVLAWHEGFNGDCRGYAVQIIPAFLFVLVFSLVTREQHQQRERAEQLVTELEGKTAALEAAHAQL